MTNSRELITEERDLRRRESSRVPKEWVQDFAERHGVPPGVKPEVHDLPNDPRVVGDWRVPSLYCEYLWRWEIKTDPTGGARQVWFVDGPRAGTSSMIPVDRCLWQVPHCPGGIDGPLERYTYAIERHRNGMWIGRSA